MTLPQSWSPASISALAAVCGSLVGALGSSVSAWIAQRHQHRRDLLARKIFHREQLYSDFITETARAMADAMQHAFQDPSRLIASYALLSRIRLSSSISVVESAEGVVTTILNTYKEPCGTVGDAKTADRDGVCGFALVCPIFCTCGQMRLSRWAAVIPGGWSAIRQLLCGNRSDAPSAGTILCTPR